MPPFGPVSRRQLIASLRQAGFDGPFVGGRHSFMTCGDRSVTIPNPHLGDISLALLSRIPRQAGVGREEWEDL